MSFHYHGSPPDDASGLPPDFSCCEVEVDLAAFTEHPVFCVFDLIWTARFTRESWHSFDSTRGLGELLNRVGETGREYLVVETPSRERYAQCMGNAGGMIIELTDLSTDCSRVMRLRRPGSTVLEHAELESWLFDPRYTLIVTPEQLFTADEAERIMIRWLMQPWAVDSN